MLEKQCLINPEQSAPCAHAKAIMWVVGILIAISVFVTNSAVKTTESVETRVAALEARRDSFVEMKTDIRYMKDDISEIKNLLKEVQ